MKQKNYKEYYQGDAFAKRSILVLASCEAEALEKYNECIARHPAIVGAIDPGLCPMLGNCVPFIDEIMKTDKELKEHGSCVI